MIFPARNEHAGLFLVNFVADNAVAQNFFLPATILFGRARAAGQNNERLPEFDQYIPASVVYFEDQTIFEHVLLVRPGNIGQFIYIQTGRGKFQVCQGGLLVPPRNAQTIVK